MYKAYDSLMEKAYKKAKADRTFTLFLVIVLLLTTTIFIFSKFIYISVRVDGGSMNPTLNSGDVLFANKNLTPKEGDIIVIDGEKESKDGKGYELLIKRAIAIGQKGKTTIVRIIHDKIWVGDSDQTLVPIDEDYYLTEGTKTPIGSSNKDRWELEEGEIFFLGDNRINSKDSRSEEYGTCDIKQVVGVVPEWAVKIRPISGFLYKVGQFFSNLI